MLVLNQCCSATPPKSAYPTTRTSEFCLGYIIGTRDSWRIAEGVLKTKAFCQPEGITADQLVAIVNKYLQDRPAELHQLATGLAIIAIREAFPWRPK